MPVNRNALIRYKTIDKCLQNRYRKWSLEDLIEACSDALYEYEGIDKGVSKRTVQADIQMMRSDKLGYNAPITVVDRKYYTYEDPNFSITNIPLSENDLDKLYETVEFMRQFRGFSHFQELDALVQKLEDHIYSQKTQRNPVIDFEKNENLKGLEYLDVIYQAIIREKTLEISYQSFRARQAHTFFFYPYWLKEFRNRWFVVGIRKGKHDMANLALDRVVGLKHSEEPYQENKKYDLKSFYQDVIGASVNYEGKAFEVKLFVEHKHAPYILTKPLHPSQKEVSRDGFGVILSLEVQHNFELEKELLSYGESVQVLEPERLKRRIKERLQASVEKYETEIREKGLAAKVKQLHYKGYSILNRVYTSREVRHIKGIIDKKLKEIEGVKPYYLRELTQKIPNLKNFLFNRNLQKIIEAIDEEAILTKATYMAKEPQNNWYVTWHQDCTINVAKKVEQEGYSGWTQKEGAISVCPPEEVLHQTFAIRIHLDDTDRDNGALKVLPGSHKKRLTDKDINLITENSLPVICELGAGGVHIMRPLVLHASSKLKNQKKRRVIHLEFSSAQLPPELEWGN